MSDSSSTHLVGNAHDIKENGPVIVEVDTLEVGVFYLDGEFHAVANFCPHQLGPLCEGDVTGCTTIGSDGWTWEYEKDGEIIACPWHAWKFDIRTGECLRGEYQVPTFDVREDDGDVILIT